MSQQQWDGQTERRVTEIERDRLLTQIDTKLTIFLDSFNKHIEQDKNDFQTVGTRIANLEKIGYGAVAVVVMLELFLKWVK